MVNLLQVDRRSRFNGRSFLRQTREVYQQAAEKFLKALLEEAGLPIPKTHLLRDLYHLTLPAYARLKSLQRGLIFLSRFAVEIRYPGKDATWWQAQAAVRWAKIKDFLWSDETGLPVDKYGEAEVQERAEEVYRHVYRAYPEIPSPLYATGAVA